MGHFNGGIKARQTRSLAARADGVQWNRFHDPSEKRPEPGMPFVSFQERGKLEKLLNERPKNG